MTDLLKLSKPFPDTYVQKKGDRGDSFVTHSVVNQALLAVVGPFGQKVVEIVRDPTLDNIITGCVLRLTVTIDGRTVEVEEAGDVENPKSKGRTDGARLKDAVSDAFKRCCMRESLGLHLWSQELYFLHKSLAEKEDTADETEASTPPQTDDPAPPAPQAPAEAGSPATGDGEDTPSLVEKFTKAIADSKNGSKGGVPSPEEEGGEGPGKDVRPSPVLTAKRAHFRDICRKAGVNPDECAAEIGAISLEACDLEQLEQLISQRGAA